MPVEFVHSVQTIFRKCWAQLHSPIHVAGYALNPEFLEYQGLDENAEVMQGLDEIIAKVLPPSEQARAAAQFQRYRNGEGVVGSPIAQENIKHMPGCVWWQHFGYEF